MDTPQDRADEARARVREIRRRLADARPYSARRDWLRDQLAAAEANQEQAELAEDAWLRGREAVAVGAT